MIYPVGTKLLCLEWRGNFFKEGNVYTVGAGGDVTAENGFYFPVDSIVRRGKFIVATELNKALI